MKRTPGDSFGGKKDRTGNGEEDEESKYKASKVNNHPLSRHNKGLDSILQPVSRISG